MRTDVRRIDALIYKGILYLMEVRQVFLDSSLSLKTLSAMLETNQTYLSNVVNRYFGCNLKELVNTYRVEYAKELLRSGRCPIEEVPVRSGFGSKSPFYVAFGKVTGMTPRQRKLIFSVYDRRPYEKIKKIVDDNPEILANEALYTPENLERARAEAETAEKCAALFGRRLEKANIAADSMRLRLARSGE